MFKRELYLKKIRKMIDKEEVKIITGIRRSGKTCLLKLIENELIERGIPEENIIYISFESAKYDHINNYKDLNDCIFEITKDIKGKIYLLFDEIQMVENWEKSINSYRIDLDSDIYITGSNSKLLSGEFATLLSGRYIRINVFPFSFKEYVEYSMEKSDMTNYEQNYNPLKLVNSSAEKLYSYNPLFISQFQNYISFGGFPALIKYDDMEKFDYIRDIYDSVILRDILERNKIKDIDLLKRLIKYAISTTGQTFSSLSISKYLKSEGIKTSPKTILNYMDQMTNSFLIYKAQREDIKGKNMLKSLEKYYVVDNSFYHMFNDEETWDMGSILESIVYIELLRRGYRVTVGKIDNEEVDFVARKNNQVIYIQVAETIMSKKTKEREHSSLKKIKDNYPKYIMTEDRIRSPVGSFIHLNIIDFLLSDYETF